MGHDQCLTMDHSLDLGVDITKRGKQEKTSQNTNETNYKTTYFIHTSSKFESEHMHCYLTISHWIRSAFVEYLPSLEAAIKVNITIITETEMTNCFIKLSDLKGNLQDILNRLFNCVSFIMRVNVIHAHCPTPRNFLHAFIQLSKAHIRSKLTQIYHLWLFSHFLTFKRFYRFSVCTVFICWVFWRFVKFQNIVDILKNNSAFY